MDDVFVYIIQMVRLAYLLTITCPRSGELKHTIMRYLISVMGILTKMRMLMP